jgi:hypothetical protein
MKGKGVGYALYKKVILALGLGFSDFNSTVDAKRVWTKLVKDPDFYSLVFSNGDKCCISKVLPNDYITTVVDSLIINTLMEETEIDSSHYGEIDNDLFFKYYGKLYIMSSELKDIIEDYYS